MLLISNGTMSQLLVHMFHCRSRSGGVVLGSRRVSMMLGHRSRGRCVVLGRRSRGGGVMLGCRSRSRGMMLGSGSRGGGMVLRSRSGLAGQSVVVLRSRSMVLRRRRRNRLAVMVVLSKCHRRQSAGDRKENGNLFHGVVLDLVVR